MRTYAGKVLLFGLTILVLGTTAYRRPASQAPTVVNKTKAVEVVSMVYTGHRTPAAQTCELVLKNISAKDINGYSVGYGEGANVTRDLTSGHRRITAGETFSLVLPQAANLVIRDVIFEDGSIDGDAVAAQELLDRREGVREQLERIAPLLNDATSTGDLENLKVQLRSLPDSTDADRSPYVAAGRRNAKEDTLLDLEKLSKSNATAGLAELLAQQNSRMARLSRRANP